jgi:cobalamin biosynthesis Mg chelatase CobN
MQPSFSKILAAMAALGVSVKKISKHQTRRANAQGRKRLTLSRGAGSISAKADIMQLVTACRYDEARAMAEAHERQCGEKLFPAAWWRTSISQG